MNPNSFRFIKQAKSQEEKNEIKRNKLLAVSGEKQRGYRLHKQLFLRNNPYLEALEAKQQIEAEKKEIEREIETFSVDDAIKLERQIKQEARGSCMDVDDMAVDEHETVANDDSCCSVKENGVPPSAVCPCCYRNSLELKDRVIFCTSCPLKVIISNIIKNWSLASFTSSLLMYIKEHEQYGCHGQVSYSFQEEIGLFSNCSDCDDIVFIE